MVEAIRELAWDPLAYGFGGPMRPRQLALYKTVTPPPAKQIWQRIAKAEQEAVIRLYARVVVRAARQRCEGRDEAKGANT